MNSASNRVASKLATFADTELLSFLHHDTRPVVVFDLNHLNFDSPTYCNPAFELFWSKCEQDPNILRVLVNASSAPANGNLTPIQQPTIAAGKKWVSFNLHGRWRVVHPVCAVLEEGSPAARPDQPEDHMKERDAANTQDLGLFIDWTRAPIQNSTPWIDFLRAVDWESTPLGGLEEWPTPLRTHVVTIMASPDPRIILWGPDDTFIYNEACVPIIGMKHPSAMGRNPRYAFAELWDNIIPLVTSVRKQGVAVELKGLPLPLERNGFQEECFFDFVLQPLCDTHGRIVGILDTFSEITASVLAERRMTTVVQVGEAVAGADGVDDIWHQTTAALEKNPADIPFSLLYSTQKLGVGDVASQSTTSSEGKSGFECTLQGKVGLSDGFVSRFGIKNLYPFDDTRTDVLGKVMAKRWSERDFGVLQEDDKTLPDFLSNIVVEGRANGVPTKKVVILTIPSLQDKSPRAFVLIGLSAGRLFDNEYRHFIRLVSDRLTHAIASISLPQEQRMAQLAMEEAALRQASLTRQLYQKVQDAESREARFARMYDKAPVGMYLLNGDGTPVYVNEAYYNISGIAKPAGLQIEGRKDWLKYIYPGDESISNAFWHEITVTHRPAQAEHRVRRTWRHVDDATGDTFEGPCWIRASAFPDLDENGNVNYVIGWVTDISLHKWTETLRLKRLEEAVEARRQSERFIDMVSHELRNPLSAILQSADGILASKTAKTIDFDSQDKNCNVETDIVIDSSQTIVLCVQHMKRIIDDILTYSKLDSKLMVLAPEVLKPLDLIDRTISMFKAELDAAKITATKYIEFEDSLSVSDKVVCDGSRILQVLINLITNAIKFTKDRDKRRIRLSMYATTIAPELSPDGVHYLARRGDRPCSRFSQDWGSGSEVYLQFSVEDTGQGLTEAETEFLFQRFRQANPKTYSQYGGSGLGLFICKELAELHCGRIGVKSKHKEGSTFAFFVKCLMHDANGDVTEKNSSFTIPERSVVDTTQSTAGAGKPLLAALPQPTSVITNSSRDIIPSSPSAQTVETLRANDLHILIVEDNIINQTVLAKQLQAAGCHVKVANHGLEALEYIGSTRFATKNKSNLQAELLHVILMDLEMPIMDGLTCVREIRSMQAKGILQGHVPTAAVTANARSVQLNEALDAGMDIVVTKPFRIKDLIPQMLALAEGRTGKNVELTGASIQ